MAELTEPLDLAYLRDLIALLRDERVQHFASGPLSLTFFLPAQETFAGLPASQSPIPKLAEEGAQVRLTASEAPADGFKHPSLWPSQNGRRLRFDGSLE